MTSFRISPLTHGSPRDVNDVPEFVEMGKLSVRLNTARQSMQPYFDKYNSAFKSITSNASPMKFLPTQIGQRFQCQNPTNMWIKIYELLAINNLIPTENPTDSATIEEKKPWRYYDFNCLPGHSLLAVNHYVFTKASDDVKDRFEWIGNVQDPEDLERNDHYDLYHNYRESGCIKYLDFSYGCPDEFDEKDAGTVDLLIGTSENHNSRDYLKQEFNDSTYLIQEVMAALSYLKQGGHAVFRLTSFFNKFTISVIAAMRAMFKSVEIFRPMSAKSDSMEVFLVCKSFYVDESNRGVINRVSDFLDVGRNDEGYYVEKEIVSVGHITGPFWTDLLNAARTLVGQVVREIESNIKLFDDVVRRCGPDNFAKQAEYSKELSKDKIETAIEKWYGVCHIDNLAKRFMLNVRAEAPREYSQRGRGGGRGGYDGRGRGGGRGSGRGGGRGGGRGRLEPISSDGWIVAGRK